MTAGTIKRVVSERGFGFIADENGNEYFFHRNGLGPSLDFDRLTGGESVTFETETGPKGPRASSVQAANRAVRAWRAALLRQAAPPREATQCRYHHPVTRVWRVFAQPASTVTS
jgi:CspA family cold shock protein